MSKKNGNKSEVDTPAIPGRKDTVSVKRFALTYLALMGAFFVLIGFKPIQNIIDMV